MIPTADNDVMIEAQRQGYVRYCNVKTGRRWEVYGVCDRRGDCLIGATIAGEMVRDHAHLADLCRRLSTGRPDSPLDVPMTPEAKGCCPFTYVELEPARGD